MGDWLRQMWFDPLPQLLSSQNKALLHFVKYDLLEEQADSASTLWRLPSVEKVLQKTQQE